MRKISLFVISALVLEHSGFGQTYTIETVAGRGWDIPGATANLSSLQGAAVDGAGNVFMALSAYSAVVRMDPSGQLALLAGNGTQGFSGDDGPGTLAQLASPSAVAVDAAGILYVLDSGNNRIRRVSKGVITTVAGGGSDYPGDNGPATSARLQLGAGYGPGLAADSAGNIYFTDANRIRKVSNGVITTVAGGGFTFADNVSAVSVFVDPSGVAVDAVGGLYFADICDNRIHRVFNGVITTVAGNGTATLFSCAKGVTGADRGTAVNVPLNQPQGVAVDTAGNVYFMEGALSGSIAPARARMVSNGTITTVAGGNTGPPFGAAVSDGVPATSALLAVAKGIATDSAGNLYIPDEYWSARVLPDGSGTYTPSAELGRLRKISNGLITTLAGATDDKGPAIGAQLNLPAGVAADGAGNVYFADASNNIIRQVSNGTITTIAGNRSDGSVQGDGGPATSANLYNPEGVGLDPEGNLYFTETGSSSVRRVSGGIITTAAAGISRTLGVALDAAGNLYVTDFAGNRILKASGGAVSTIAGNGTSGFSGDNGPATSAQLAGPSGIALDAAGNVYFTDTGNQRVREISNGIITTVAGNGTSGFSGDGGPAINALLSFPPPGFLPLCCGLTDPLPRFPQLPAGIAVDVSGSLYIVDSGNQRIRKVSNGVITTIAGDGIPGYSGDGGPATSAQLNNPSGIALDAAGRIYVSDSSNGRIRALIPPGCSFIATPSSIQTPTSGGTFSITIQTGASCSWLISGFPDWITLATPPPVRGTATVSLVIAANTGEARIANMVVAGQSVTVIQAPASGFAPKISLIANAFGENPTIAPNTWVEIKGSNLAPAGDSRIWQDADFADGQLPIQLDGVSVMVNGKSALVYYISPTQVNILTPPDALSGPVQAQLTAGSVTSNVATVQARPLSLSFFEFVSTAGNHYVYGRHLADNSVIGLPGTTPVKPGETIYVATTGFGPTDTPVVAGSLTQSGTLPTPWPEVQVGNVPANVRFAGLISPGTYIVTFDVPTDLPDGELALTATYKGLSIQPNLLIAVQH